MNPSAVPPAQLVYWISGAILSLLSAAVIIVAAVRFRSVLALRSAEALMKLEAEFRSFDIKRLIDPEAKRFETSGLKHALFLGLADRQNERSDPEEALVKQVDDFLGFVVTLIVLHDNGLITSASLWKRYHYWLRALSHQDLLRLYVAEHYPIIFAFLGKRRSRLKMWWYNRRQRTSRDAARLIRDELQFGTMPEPPAAVADAPAQDASRAYILE